MSRERAVSWAEYSLALDSWPAPRSWERREVPATDRPLPKETKIQFTGHTKVVAAKCTEEILLTQRPSTRL